MTSLNTAERSSLLDLIAAADTPRFVIRRAVQLLRDDARSGTGGTNPWLTRFREHGPEGLNRARTPLGRPATKAEVAERVLTEPLRSTAATVTSRDVANRVGVSQSTVVRCWSRAYDAGLIPDQTREALDAMVPGRLEGIHLSGSQCLIAITAQTRDSSDGARPVAGKEVDASRLHQLALRTLLAADLLRAALPEAPTPRLDALIRHPRASQRALLLAREPLDATSAATLSRRDDLQCEVLSAQAWQACLHPLEAVLAHERVENLLTMLQSLRAWAQDGSRPMNWWPGASTAPPRRASRRPPPSTQTQRTASSVTTAIQQAVLEGQLKSGDRVTESFIARSAHISRSRAREALRTIALDGLVDLEPGPGAVVPEPTLDDVQETYAARLALGRIIVQRATNWQPATIGPVRQAVEQLGSAALTGDSWITGEADLAFQDALAESVDMRRIPGMFTRLSVQLSMFVAVMGLDYAFDVQAMVDDDSALFQAIIRRDTPLALRLWEQKLGKSAKYMTRQLETRRTR